MEVKTIGGMEKDFDNWNSQKKEIHHKGIGRFYHEREIWWCALGVNVGNEHDGGGSMFQRPVLIIKGLSKHTCIIIPLTTSKNEHPMRIPLGNIAGKESAVIISQLRVIDTRRFTERLGILGKNTFKDIQKSVRTLF